MSAITTLNPKAEVARAAVALQMNTSAARGLQEVLATNLGPKGTMKMLVSGAGDIKMTKDGNVLLHEMQIQHPTASLIARAATAQDDDTGDGTTSSVLLTGELLKQAEMFITEGVHPRLIADGFEQAKEEAIKVLDGMKTTTEVNRDMLCQVARTSLRTKVDQDLADHITEELVDAYTTIQGDDTSKPIDLFMVEIMPMQHKTETDTKFHKGIVLDHGARHPDMPKRLANSFILTCNVSLEYEKTEVNSGLFYKTAEQREKFAYAERKFIDDRVEKIIAFKKQVCDDDTKTFVIVNQKGIDPISLEALAKEGIFAVRRAKRRNMERVTLACGGTAMNSVDKLTVECLGHADEVYEHVLGEQKFTYIGGVANPKSVTLIVSGPNGFTIAQIKDAIRDGLRAINNTIIDQAVIPGAGAFEIKAHQHLLEFKKTVKGRARLGVQAFADALLIIPKVLGRNAGFDAQDTIVTLQQAAQDSEEAIGLDINTGEECLPLEEGIVDNYRVKREILQSCTMLASNLLIVDEVMRAGLSSLKQ